jgi:hypothetical protein
MTIDINKIETPLEDFGIWSPLFTADTASAACSMFAESMEKGYLATVPRSGPDDASNYQMNLEVWKKLAFADQVMFIESYLQSLQVNIWAGIHLKNRYQALFDELQRFIEGMVEGVTPDIRTLVYTPPTLMFAYIAYCRTKSGTDASKYLNDMVYAFIRDTLRWHAEQYAKKRVEVRSTVVRTFLNQLGNQSSNLGNGTLITERGLMTDEIKIEMDVRKELADQLKAITQVKYPGLVNLIERINQEPLPAVAIVPPESQKNQPGETLYTRSEMADTAVRSMRVTRNQVVELLRRYAQEKP